MDNGFQGVFLLLVLFFWILEGILSARRKRQGGELPGEVQLPGELPPVPSSGGRGQEDTPDREVWQDGTNPREKYRTLPGRPSGRPMTWGERHGEVSSTEPSPVPGGPGEKAEGMIPRGLWEELGALARGERPTPAEPAPSPAPVGREPQAGGHGGGRSIEEVAAARKRDGYDLPTRRRETAPTEPRRDVVGSDAAMAARVRHTPALRLSPEEVPTVGTRTSARGGGKGGILRSLAGGVTTHELRRAVILHEILGPPVALRGREWESQEGEGVRRPGLG